MTNHVKLIAMVAAAMHNRTDIVDEIDTLLAPFGARKLSTVEMKSYSGNFSGWEVELEIVHVNESVIIDLVLPDSFPAVLPVIFLKRPKLMELSFPHLENNGKLCIWDNMTCVNPKDPSFVVELLEDTALLIKDGLTGALDQDFHNEFTSYWNYHNKTGNFKRSICDLQNKRTRRIVVNYTKGQHTFGDNETILISFLNNINSNNIDFTGYTLEQSLLICLNDTWLPSQFPNTIQELLQLVKADSSNQKMGYIERELLNTINVNQAYPSLLVSFNAPNNTCVIAIEFESSINKRKNQYHKVTAKHGFNQTMPVAAFLARVSNFKIFGRNVTRHDQSWIMGRDHNTGAMKLSEEVITIIGCGSIGAATAKLLLQSGVMNLNLFDDELLSTENPSRHLLGCSSAGLSKTEELAKRLRADFPLSNINAYKAWTAYDEQGVSFTALENSEIIVSCTADWLTDQALIDMQTQHKFGPIVFSFVEPHAMAGHVIVNPEGSNAFNSLHIVDTNRVGKLKFPATQWQESTIRKVPACAGSFQPYGVIPLIHTQSMLVESILHHLTSNELLPPTHSVWFESTKELNLLNGKWSDSWINEYGSPGDGKCQKRFAYDGTHWIKQ